jgi:hypothetical protein
LVEPHVRLKDVEKDVAEHHCLQQLSKAGQVEGNKAQARQEGKVVYQVPQELNGGLPEGIIHMNQ